MSISAVKYDVDEDPVIRISAPGAIKSARTVHLRTEPSDDPVYIGPADVTSATGCPIYHDDVTPFVVRLGAQDSLYAVCATGQSATVHVLTTT